LNAYFHGYHLVRKLTVNLDDVFWHPLSTEADMQVTTRIFLLTQAVARVQRRLEAIACTSSVPLMTFSCG
jgi:hypothetical protein